MIPSANAASAPAFASSSCFKSKSGAVRGVSVKTASDCWSGAVARRDGAAFRSGEADPVEIASPSNAGTKRRGHLLFPRKIAARSEFIG